MSVHLSNRHDQFYKSVRHVACLTICTDDELCMNNFLFWSIIRRMYVVQDHLCQCVKSSVLLGLESWAPSQGMMLGPEVLRDLVKFLGRKGRSDGQLIFLGTLRTRRKVLRLMLVRSWSTPQYASDMNETNDQTYLEGITGGWSCDVCSPASTLPVLFEQIMTQQLTNILRCRHQGQGCKRPTQTSLLLRIWINWRSKTYTKMHLGTLLQQRLCQTITLEKLNITPVLLQRLGHTWRTSIVLGCMPSAWPAATPTGLCWCESSIYAQDSKERTCCLWF